MLNGAPLEREWGMTLQMPAGGHLRNEGGMGVNLPIPKIFISKRVEFESTVP